MPVVSERQCVVRLQRHNVLKYSYLDYFLTLFGYIQANYYDLTRIHDLTKRTCFNLVIGATIPHSYTAVEVF
jgi:hypothetical protein